MNEVGEETETLRAELISARKELQHVQALLEQQVRRPSSLHHYQQGTSSACKLRCTPISQDDLVGQVRAERDEARRRVKEIEASCFLKFAARVQC